MRKILTTLTGFPAYDEIRILDPLRHVISQLKDERIIVEICDLSKISEQICRNYDVTIFHGCPNLNTHNLLRKIPYVIATDDYMLDLPNYNPARSTKAEIEGLKWAFEHAQNILSTTQYLKDKLGYSNKTFVVSNLIDLEPVENKSNNVLWAGGNSHMLDIELLAYLRLQHRKIIFFGHTLPNAFAKYVRDNFGNVKLVPNKENIGWLPITTNYEQYCNWMKNLDFGVGLCPLLENEFNKCKSDLKCLEYLKQGAVSVVSNVGPYADIPVECVVKVDAVDDWNEAIELAFDYRETIYKNMFEWAKENRTYENNKCWLEMYRAI